MLLFLSFHHILEYMLLLLLLLLLLSAFQIVILMGVVYPLGCGDCFNIVSGFLTDKGDSLLVHNSNQAQVGEDMLLLTHQPCFVILLCLFLFCCRFL